MGIIEQLDGAILAHIVPAHFIPARIDSEGIPQSAHVVPTRSFFWARPYEGPPVPGDVHCVASFVMWQSRGGELLLHNDAIEALAHTLATRAFRAYRFVPGRYDDDWMVRAVSKQRPFILTEQGPGSLLPTLYAAWQVAGI